jgi:Na+/melibiose symporter-like transporter
MSSNSSLPVYTAACLDSSPRGSKTKNAELEEPLLNIESQTSNEAEAFDAKPLNTTFCISGMILGFLVQLVNVGGTTYMYLRWGDEKITNTSQDGWFLHFVISILTQSDLSLYIFMWIALTGVLTKRGMDHARNTYFSESCMPTKRSVFVMGVNFYVGVVIGVFLAWTGIDVLLGSPVPMLPMIFVLLFGLFISYTMIWCYDLEDENEDAEY